MKINNGKIILKEKWKRWRKGKGTRKIILVGPQNTLRPMSRYRGKKTKK